MRSCSGHVLDFPAIQFRSGRLDEGRGINREILKSQHNLSGLWFSWDAAIPNVSPQTVSSSSPATGSRFMASRMRCSRCHADSLVISYLRLISHAETEFFEKHTSKITKWVCQPAQRRLSTVAVATGRLIARIPYPDT